jgi:hypothetical protein
MNALLRALLAGVALASLHLGAAAQGSCEIRIVQEGQAVAPYAGPPLQSYRLKPGPFRLEVTPGRCNPSIAALPDAKVANDLLARPLIWSERSAFLAAGTEGDQDVLVWWAREDVDPSYLEPPPPNTFKGRQYRQLCDELKACPQVYPAYSSSWPFVPDGTKGWTADFRRIGPGMPLEEATGRTVGLVVYLLWRELSSEFAKVEAEHLLFEPRLLRIDFVAPQEAPQDAPRDAPRDAPQEAPQEAPRDIPQDLPQDPPPEGQRNEPSAPLPGES